MIYEKLSKKVDKKIAHATTVRWGDPDGVIDGPDGRQHEDQSKVLVVRFHATDILYLYPDGSVRVCSGGFRTPITRERIRTYSGIRVQTMEGLWFVYRDGKTHLTPFYDGMLFDPKGAPVAPHKETYASMMKRKHALDRVVRRYIKDFNAALKKQVDETGEMRKPDSGDCLYCSMFGDMVGIGHILSHFAEDYYVPSLLYNAMREGRSGTSWQSGRPTQEKIDKSVSLDWFMAENDFQQGRAVSWFVSRALRSYLSKRKWRLMECFDPAAFKKERAEHQADNSPT